MHCSEDGGMARTPRTVPILTHALSLPMLTRMHPRRHPQSLHQLLCGPVIASLQLVVTPHTSRDQLISGRFKLTTRGTGNDRVHPVPFPPHRSPYVDSPSNAAPL